jgi:membrane protein
MAMARWADKPQSDRDAGGRARRTKSMEAGSDRGRQDRRRSALWAAGLAVALMAMGFKRRPHAGAGGGSRRNKNEARRVTRSDNPALRQSYAGGDALRAAGEQHDRGRSATTPSEIPARGWKDILLRIYHNLSEHRVVAIAAGVTFYVLLAIFPAIAALVSVYGLFADAKTISDHLASAASFLPGGAVDIIGEQLQRLTAQPSSKLGLTFFTGLAISLWSANAGVKALFDALNIVYGEKEKRSFVKLNAVSLAFTVGGLIFALVAIAAVVALPVALNYIGLGRATELLITIGRWPILFAAVALWIALIYRYGPSRDTPKWRWVTWGSAFASFAWIVLSILFSWYATNFGSYNKTYGSLGAAIGFMTWIWLSTIVILLGAELDAEMEHQTARDTTTGTPKPLGARGAMVADTVGAAQE